MIFITESLNSSDTPNPTMKIQKKWKKPRKCCIFKTEEKITAQGGLALFGEFIIAIGLKEIVENFF